MNLIFTIILWLASFKMFFLVFEPPSMPFLDAAVMFMLGVGFAVMAGVGTLVLISDIRDWFRMRSYRKQNEFKKYYYDN